ncbi:MAG: prepilin-type N-terminal cleavage/methylation domain-containing protein [bacterium]|nr:prepilin-type N-terminal cleavage/methylation domain-containing protein [bacterium]
MKNFLKNKNGFTLIELIIFIGIFVIVISIFFTVLVSISGMQVKSLASNQVNQEAQFALSTIQRYIESASLIDMPTNIASTTLKLRMPNDNDDPIYIYLSSGVIYFKKGIASPQPLTTNKVNVTNLSFIKKSNLGAKDSVSIYLTVEYNTQNITQKFAKNLVSSIARVSAATFDSDIRASTTNFYKIGAQAGEWQSINNTIYFSGSNVGINVSNPQATLEINGGLRINTSLSQPSCSASTRGTVWISQGGGGIKDSVQVCVKNASDTYQWFSIY